MYGRVSDPPLSGIALPVDTDAYRICILERL